MLKYSALIGLTFCLTQAMAAVQPNYCLAIRGNGELEPAHWGATANVIEKLGLPRAQAGGSSASITMLLLDGIASNPLVAFAPPNEKSARAALLVKSMHGFIENVADLESFKNVQHLFSPGHRLEALKETVLELNASIEDLSSAHPNKVKLAATNLLRIFENLKGMGIFQVKGYEPLVQAVTTLRDTFSTKANSEETIKLLDTAYFYAHQLKFSLEHFGAFDARADDTLFFRPGLVDFESLADQLGRIAQFYSLRSADNDEMDGWEKFFSLCTGPSGNKTWADLIKTENECAVQFSKIVTLHFNSKRKPVSFADQLVGVSIPTLVSTSVLVGSAFNDAEKGFSDYQTQLDVTFGRDFKVSEPENVKFGYWGAELQFLQIRKAMASRIERDGKLDAKSERFLSLGHAPWKVALSLSPAEPGLSPMKKFKANGADYYSAGGWTDPHPVQVLKAAGCETVVYITRQGGDSLFIQGVANRLLSLGLDWKHLSTKPDDEVATRLRNAEGDADDQTSLWSRLYNLANPFSSFKSALTTADATLCTRWDKYRITDGVEGMVNEAYQARYHVTAQGEPKGLGHLPKLDSRLEAPGCK